MYHSFVDESKDPAYLLVATLVRPANIVSVRKAVTAMIMPGQRRIHFHKERSSRKTQIIGRLLDLPIEAVIYEARHAKDQKIAREHCLTRLVQDHLVRDVRRLVLERDESLGDFDRRLLRKETQASGAVNRLAYEELRAFEEPLLCLPDAIAWCWSRGDHWRVKAKGLVTEVFQA